ncbi:hypothetical protein BC628DRAFT_830689 [Trametes gibbosa]|nr:hypothetical protein BC628DRAFT_830689 [Trametes gibbosa]
MTKLSKSFAGVAPPIDCARLEHIELLYNLQETLTLRPPATDSSTSIPGYDTCVFLPASKVFTPERGLVDKLVGALCTRLTTTPAAIRAAITSMGQGMQASSYELLVDKNARYRNRPVILEKKTFYGQLRQILVVHLHPVPSATPPQNTPSTIVLGAIRCCLIKNDHRTLDIHYYKHLGALELVDITTVQCLVGRVQDRGCFAIIDRSGSLSRAIYNK